jgi:hypothetical protein
MQDFEKHVHRARSLLYFGGEAETVRRLGLVVEDTSLIYLIIKAAQQLNSYWQIEDT